MTFERYRLALDVVAQCEKSSELIDAIFDVAASLPHLDKIEREALRQCFKYEFARVEQKEAAA